MEKENIVLQRIREDSKNDKEKTNFLLRTRQIKQKIICFLDLLDGEECKSIFYVSEKDFQNARIIFGENYDDDVLQNRIIELRTQYDWNAAKKIIEICPHNERHDNLLRDLYSIIDKKLLAHQSLKVKKIIGSSPIVTGCVSFENGTCSEEIISEARLRGARNFITLFINMLFASAWHKITAGEKSDEFEKYKKFINSFDRCMQREGQNFYSKYNLESRNFYLFSTSFVSFNFEMVFPWILMNSHYELNHRGFYIEDRPMKLWLDYSVEHRGRKSDENDDVVSTLEFTEAVASRENEDAHIGSELNRCGKFYFAHGSQNWRECPVCGRMTFYFGYDGNKWNYKSKQLVPPFPIPIFENEKIKLTEQEEKWRKNLRYDSMQCMHCGAETRASDAPMIVQTMYKSTPTSFLEEIQRNVKVSVEKARHIVLFGYSIPSDDTIWQQTFAEGVRSRLNSENKAYCSVVVGYNGEKRWIYGNELEDYVNKHKNEDDSYGVGAIENACAIFGKENVRAYCGGIPNVFGNCSESDVKELFYPDFVDWRGTRL